MKVLIDKRFERDVQLVNDSSLNKRIEAIVIDRINSNSLQTISNTRKLAGFKTYYRIRISDYRLGPKKLLYLSGFCIERTFTRNFPDP